MRRLWIAFFLFAALITHSHAQNLSMPCSTASEFCGELVSPHCANTTTATTPAEAGGSGECAGDLKLYRDCIELVSASCSGQPKASSALASPQSPERGGGAQTLVSENGQLTLRGCYALGEFIFCDLMLQAGDTRDLQVCASQFSLILTNGPVLVASAVELDGRQTVTHCGSQELSAEAPARLLLKFNTQQFTPSQMVKLTAFEAVLFDSVLLE